VIEIADPQSTLAVGTIQPFVDRFIERGGATHVDYVHGDDTLERLAMNGGSVGLHLPAVGKDSLLRMVVREGPLPRKTFSMGGANQKRYYIEARRIREPSVAPVTHLQGSRSTNLVRPARYPSRLEAYSGDARSSASVLRHPKREDP
jgi:hypothetical protein